MAAAEMSYQDYLEDFEDFVQKTEDFLKDGQQIITNYQHSNLLYLHLGHELAVNDWFYQYFQIEQAINSLQQQFGKNFPHEREQFIYFTARLQAYLLGNFLLLVAKNYDIYRYLEEGDLYLVYGENSFTKLVQQYQFLRKKYQLLPQLSPQLTGPWQEVAQQLEKIVNNWQWWNSFQRQKIRQIQDLLPYHFIVNLGGKIVQAFTEILSKRETSISLRFWTNFRDNYLRTNYQQVEQILVRELSLRPGDILAEKDFQANTDLLIPGYWGHNGVYLGTIDSFRRLNIWHHHHFQKIREYILSYRYDRGKRRTMEELDLFSVDFELVHWVLESNRDGVKVIPLRRFLSVDGLALLRANRSWTPMAYKKLFFRANYFMGKDYDHTHDVRNKRGMTCSKFIGYLYSEITFPVSQYLHYLIIGPDQIVSAVNRDFFHRDQGGLKLLAFFDGADGGRLKYHYHFFPTSDGYQQFIATLPALP